VGRALHVPGALLGLFLGRARRQRQEAPSAPCTVEERPFEGRVGRVKEEPRLDRVLKNPRFVSGHRFSDAVNQAESIPAPAAVQLGRPIVSSSANSLAPEDSKFAVASINSWPFAFPREEY
jgi:hypothetical protein